MLVKSQNQIRKFVPTTVEFDFTDIKPIIQNQTEPWLRKKILGEVQYDKLEEKVINGTPALDADEEALLAACYNLIANDAYLRYIPLGNIKIGKGGFTTFQDGNFVPASQARTEDLKKYFSNAAAEAEESLLLFLENKKDVFTDWASSSCYSVFKECFINTADQFSEDYHDIRSSRRLFKAMKTIMKRVEKQAILSIICKGLFDQIKSQVKTNTVSANNAKLIPFINMAVAKQTMAIALVELPLILTEDGVQLSGIMTSQQTVVTKTPATAQDKSPLIESCKSVADSNLKDLRDYLEANAADYPLYEASTCYIGNTDPTVNTIDTGGGITMIS